MMKKYTILVFFVFLAFSCTKDETEISGVVINELMAVNSYSAMDQDNEFDDWIELYNNSAATVDLSGYYLTDSKKKLSKWKFPAGTNIAAKSFLIIWADSDTLQFGLHANFKLSSAGEKVFLVNPELLIADEVEYGEQTSELSYGRTPNGTGNFKWKMPTFNNIN